MKISCFIPSFNKHEYVLDAINSVINQTHQDWELYILENSNDDKTREVVKKYIEEIKDDRIKYVEINFTPEERKEKYPTAVLLNEYYLKAEGELIFYLSDDDIFYQTAFEEVNNYFESRPTVQAIYFSHKCLSQQEDGSFLEVNKIEASKPRGKGTSETFDCQVDGGQVVHKKLCLDFLEQPYFAITYPDASHCDGLFLEALGKQFTVEPIGSFLGAHRRTRKSTWTQ